MCVILVLTDDDKALFSGFRRSPAKARLLNTFYWLLLPLAYLSFLICLYESYLRIVQIAGMLFVAALFK
mgnify:CR=1 FL=1